MSADAIADEGRRLARHLLGRDAPADCVEAYVAAHALPGGRAWQRNPDDASRFALAHPWAIGPIDAAGAVTKRAPVLRAKLLLMTAILETAPQLADDFLPRREGASQALLALARHGLRAAASCVVGLPLVLVLGAERP